MAVSSPSQAQALQQAAVTTAAPAAAPSDAAQRLIEHANYWRARGDLGAALKDFQRVISFDQRNPDVLATAAELAFQIGDYKDATTYRAMLRDVAPGDPRNKTLEPEHPLTPQEAAILGDARRLAQAGKNVDAVLRYKAFFHGEPVTPSLAIEYYPALGSSSPEGFDEARTQLAALTAASPDDGRLQLAYAKLLIIQEDSRAEGIARLARLASDPGVGAAARQAWREVLLWQGASEKARTQLLAYLQTNPSDRQLDAKRREFDAVLPDESAKSMNIGYFAIASHDPVRAEQQFATALALNPNNADALVMMAAIRRSQNRYAEAQVLIDKAVAIAPDRRDELLHSAGGVHVGPLPSTLEDRVQIAALTAGGKYAQAETLLSHLIAGQETEPTLIQLGNLQLRAGHADAAGVSFRKATAMAPANGDAVCGLASVAVAKGNYGDATSFYEQAATLFTKAKDRSGLRRVTTGRAALLRIQTAQADAPARVRASQTAANSHEEAVPLPQRGLLSGDVMQAAVQSNYDAGSAQTRSGHP